MWLYMPYRFVPASEDSDSDSDVGEGFSFWRTPVARYWKGMTSKKWRDRPGARELVLGMKMKTLLVCGSFDESGGRRSR